MTDGDAIGTRPAVLNFISNFIIIYKSFSSVEVNVNRYEIYIDSTYGRRSRSSKFTSTAVD